MSAQANDFPEKRHVSKVTFSSISSDVLVVKIRKVSAEVREEDIPKMSASSRSSTMNPGDKQSQNLSRSTMTDTQSTASSSSQTARSEKTPVEDSKLDYTPCIKHAAENIGRKAGAIPSEKINLCDKCSKSMLSYIFLVQDFLDSLAREISGVDARHCLQCAREEARNSLMSLDIKEAGDTSNERATRVSTESKQKDASEVRPTAKRTSRAKGHQEVRKQETKKIEGGYQKNVTNPPSQRYLNQPGKQMEFIYTVQDTQNVTLDSSTRSLSNSNENRNIIIQEPSSKDESSSEQKTEYNRKNINQERSVVDNSQWSAGDNRSASQNVAESHQINTNIASGRSAPQTDGSASYYGSHTPQHADGQSSSKQIFRTPMERLQPNYNESAPVSSNQRHDNGSETLFQSDSGTVPVQSPTLFREDVDGIISTLSNVEREIYDSARNTAGWEGLSMSAEKLGMSPENLVTSEAFVTSCRNNAEAIGCLVTGTSLLLCRTTRTLCVLVSEGVSSAFRGALSAVFQVVQYVRSLDSLGTTKLALLEQPDLGITFEKLHIWRLVQFTKCVYLNPDTLVVQNCDELFCREELSAVPDIGWPDCFNSGVFVFSPSLRTFWQLMEFAEKQGSYDGGDQGLLNSYFSSWSTDISKKLSFIYNLMANVSYTYTPAFRQFGRDVKIVQFHGSFKPWHVKFFTASGQISPTSPVHPTYVQFVHIWLSIFRISVLRLMSQEIQSYAASQETICAVEILRFFPLPSESEVEFFLTPPSVRLRLAEKKLKRSTSLPVAEDRRRRKSEEVFRFKHREEVIEEISSPAVTTSDKPLVKETPPTPPTSDVEIGARTDEQAKSEATISSDAGKVTEETNVVKKVVDKNAIPGAEVGDYQGMKAWEQGRMDYQGVDSSDNVIKRLEFLMSKRKS